VSIYSRTGHDATTNIEKEKGVNIVLNLGNNVSPEVTFSARYCTVLNIIKIITDVAALKWSVQNASIVIEPGSVKLWDPIHP